MTDPVEDAAAELYRVQPDDFVAVRDERVKALRAEGRAAEAKEVAALRKPTLSAWMVNLLVADDPALADQVSELADQLRAAQEQLSGAELRALGRQRQQLVAGLVARARHLARDAGRSVTGSAADTEVESTLRAALADPQLARDVLSGRLTHAAEFSGFGSVAAGPRPSSSHARDPGTPTKGSARTPGQGRGGGGGKAGGKQATAASAKESAAERRREEQREQALAQLREAQVALEEAEGELAESDAGQDAAAQALAAARTEQEAARRRLAECDRALDAATAEDEQARWRRKRAAAALKAAQASVRRAEDRYSRTNR